MRYPVTRIEIANHIEAAFGPVPASRADLIAAARDSGARDETIQLLQRLPDKQYARLRQLWVDLPDVPVEA